MNDTDGNCPTFYGKYRGVVIDNEDEDGLGRVRVKVLDVWGENESGWAMPSLPYAGDGVGLYLIPPIDAFVWIEFEHGDPEYPIWTGCFWLSNISVPVEATGPDIKMLKTEAGTIILDDSPNSGGITIETTDGKTITMNSEGIIITNGEAIIEISGNKVSINDDALEVV
jgi:uncharacterized protein involved in type VI secretion and phage assembly